MTAESILDLRADIVREAESWLHTPFHVGAHVKGAGVDCGYLLIESARVAVAVPKDVPYFPIDWYLNTKAELFLGIVERYAFPVDHPEPGDVALFRLRSGQPYSHAAVVVNWPLVIHARWKRGVQWGDASKPPLSGCETIFMSPFHESV
jgi:cell wall-associated NlpC family hydrolase